MAFIPNIKVLVKVCLYFVLAGIIGLFVTACETEVSQKTIPQASLSPFELESSSILKDQTGVSPDEPLILLFSTPLLRTALGDQLEAVSDFLTIEQLNTNESILGEWNLDTFDRRLVFTPQPAWPSPGIEISVTISPELLDQDNQPFAGGTAPVSFAFKTVEDFEAPEFSGIDSIESICGALRIRWTEAKDNFTPSSQIRYRVHSIPRPGSFTSDFLELTGETEALLTQLSSGTFHVLTVTALDLANNETVDNNPQLALGGIIDRVPPSFSGLQSIVPPAETLEATTLHLKWNAGEDNCDASSLRYVIYLKTCVEDSVDCQELPQDQECQQAAQDCGTTQGDCDIREPSCIRTQEECAKNLKRCGFTAEEILESPDLVHTTSTGVTEFFLENLEPDRRYQFLVRALDSSDNQDLNTTILEAETRVSFQASVSSVIARAGCLSAGCHDPSTRSGGLDLSSYDSLVLMGGTTKNPPTVTPGEADQSQLYLRVTSPETFARMPPCWDARLPLCPKEIDIIQRWIDEGAGNN